MQNKICARCKTKKPLVEFGRNRARIKYDGYSVYCKLCILAIRKEWAKNHKEHIRKYSRKYSKSWRQSPRGVYWGLKYNARWPVSITSDMFVEWFREQPQQCFYCGRKFNKQSFLEELTIDRKDSLTEYIIGNIVLSCRRCNHVKSNILTADEMIQVAKTLGWLLE